MTRAIVLTGGPGAGKTAVLEVVTRHFCPHVVVLPEAAGMLWKGGFPRRESLTARCAAQRAIYRVQVELEWIATEDGEPPCAVLCDRGTLDSLAYWPDDPARFYRELDTTHARELARYDTVIHLRVPHGHHGYNHSNPERIETARQAAAIDARIAEVWAGHPNLITVDSEDDFLMKLQRALEVLRAELGKVPCSCPTPFSSRSISRNTPRQRSTMP